MLVPIAMGVDVQIVDSVGPEIARPIRMLSDVGELHQFARADIEFLRQTIKLLRAELKIPLIGFAGAPFTLASYLIEGRPSRDWLRTKHLMYTDPEFWSALMDKLTTATIFYLLEQADAGAQALQLFDSWVGCLSAADFRRFVQPYNQRILQALEPTGLPRIVFGTDTAAILTDFAAGFEVAGLDWRIDLARARQLLPHTTLQGNLDPAVLGAGWPVIASHADKLLKSLPDRRGYIFNLGHGVWKQANPDHLRRLVDYVHNQ